MSNVLIVDDDAAVRILIAALMERCGRAVDFAADGNEAIAKLRCHSYDVVLLDLMMPFAGGCEVVQYMKREQQQMLSRTILITAASARALEQFDESAVGGVLQKPFDINVLIAMVDGVVERHSKSER